MLISTCKSSTASCISKLPLTILNQLDAPQRSQGITIPDAGNQQDKSMKQPDTRKRKVPKTALEQESQKAAFS